MIIKLPSNIVKIGITPILFDVRGFNCRVYQQKKVTLAYVCVNGQQLKKVYA